ncbi:hypothetical protein APUTEX25_001022 [Auxenochlorella protothecoides]|uniref:Uncharacterized protein n=1 Tax=Auxenochlorella protothecoides TaxID=3075 RepID=A0A3M7KQU6_AUXPR|nr:hypothetical protein APUTEX25_001022 [Auxenochlorella protothecoides]|eukprot:RMZ52903.1 hypothetical protein APUTEX25_001022 [Auxenochlorella protothecoides]
MPSVSGGVSTPTSATAAGGEVVSASLEGLVHALDGLKTSLGYDDFATVQSLIGDLRAENLELRSYAETAIREAQKLKEAHDALAEQLAERALEDRVGRAVAETNRLASLADDFDRELAPGRGEEVERAKREAEALRARVGDLEAERADLERRLAAAERRAQEAEHGDVATQRLLSALVARAGLQAALAVAEAEAAQLKTGVRPGSGGRGTPRSSPHAAMAQDEGGAASQGSQAHPAQPGAAHQDGAGGAQVAGTLAGTAAQTAAQTVIPQAGGFASASVSRTTTAEQAVSPALAAADRGGAAAPLPAGPASPTGSAASEAARALAADRAAADAAWEDYAASSDLPALKRARAELEARCALLEAQIGKMAGELEEADQDKAEIEARVDAAVRTGDVTPLKEPTPKRTPGAKTGGGKSQGGRARATLGRMFRGLGGGSSKSREASADAEAGRAGGGDAAGVPAKAAAPVVPLAPGEAEEELRAVRAENQMIMEHLVMTKIRMAEMEGDYLESKRALLRAREKQLELTKKLTAVQAAAPALLAPARSTTSAGPLSAAAAGSPPGPQASEVGESGGATPEPATAPSPSPRDSGRSGGSRGLRIPGLA